VTPAEPPEAAIRVVRGEPTAEEVAALVVVLAALSRARRAAADGTDAMTAARGSWTDRANLVTSAWAAGRDGWRAAAARR